MDIVSRRLRSVDVFIDIFRCLPRSRLELLQITSFLFNFIISNARNTLPRRPISNSFVLVESFKFLTRLEVERMRMVSFAMNGIITAASNVLALRRIAYVLFVDSPFPGRPFHMCISEPDRAAVIPIQTRLKRRAVQYGFSGGWWTNVYDVAEAMSLLRHAFIDKCVVHRTPSLAVLQSLAARPMDIGVLRYNSSLRTPTSLPTALRYKRLEWHINIRIVIDDQHLLRFVFRAPTPFALRVEYNGRLSNAFLLEFIQRMAHCRHHRLPEPALCLDIRTPVQQLGAYNNLKRGTDDDWTLRIDNLDLSISWDGERLRISNSHPPAQHCSCFTLF